MCSGKAFMGAKNTEVTASRLSNHKGFFISPKQPETAVTIQAWPRHRQPTVKA